VAGGAEAAARAAEAAEAALGALNPAAAPGQAEVLAALYAACGGPRWRAARGWRAASPPPAAANRAGAGGSGAGRAPPQPLGDPCRDNWEGVTCSAGVVIALDLSGNGLDCPAGLPRQLGALRALQSLNLERNAVGGSLAQADLCAIINIRHINLSANRLTGAIPECYAALPRLETLALDTNDLSGRVPPLLLRRSGLQLLHLHGNVDLTLQREDGLASRIPALCVLRLRMCAVWSSACVPVRCWRRGEHRGERRQRGTKGRAAVAVAMARMCPRCGRTRCRCAALTALAQSLALPPHT
jgi:hypothetical protein